MDIGFFVNYKDQVVQLPVNPEKVTITCKGNNSTTEIIKLGQINLLKERKLSTISFESFFPENDWFPAVRTRGMFKKPAFYKKFFQTIMEDKKPCRLVITGIDISMKVSVEEFEYYHQGGDHEDTYYSLEFLEYKDYHIAEIPVTSSAKVSTTTTTTKKTTAASSSSSSSTTLTPTKITIGCQVILNGRVHYDSYGSKPGKTFKDYRGKIGYINLKGSHPYCVLTPDGGGLGWVTKESVVLV